MSRSARHRRRKSSARRWLPGLVIAAVATTVVWIGARHTDSSSLTAPDMATAQDALREIAPPPASTPVPTVASPPPVPPRVPAVGPGTFTVADGRTDVIGSGRKTEYRVEIEDGLPVSAGAFAEAVDKTLADERGWTSQGYAFQRTSDAQLRIVLASPATTDRLCHPLQTKGRVSCRNGKDVVINARRWVDGAKSYPDDLARYRQYVVNHEVGHSFGLGHRPCPATGAKAPVMLQQTIGLQGCEANPWP